MSHVLLSIFIFVTVKWLALWVFKNKQIAKSTRNMLILKDKKNTTTNFFHINLNYLIDTYLVR